LQVFCAQLPPVALLSAATQEMNPSMALSLASAAWTHPLGGVFRNPQSNRLDLMQLT
jgi:hypothetical protein